MRCCCKPRRIFFHKLVIIFTNIAKLHIMFFSCHFSAKQNCFHQSIFFLIIIGICNYFKGLQIILKRNFGLETNEKRTNNHSMELCNIHIQS